MSEFTVLQDVEVSGSEDPQDQPDQLYGVYKTTIEQTYVYRLTNLWY